MQTENDDGGNISETADTKLFTKLLKIQVYSKTNNKILISYKLINIV